MKNTLIAAIFGFLTLGPAQIFAQTELPRPSVSARPSQPVQGEPPPKQTHEMRELSTSDLRDIHLNAVSGTITFSVGDIEYVYAPAKDSHAVTTASDRTNATTACIALLGELRKADKFKVAVPIELPKYPSDRKWIIISELIIQFDKLK